MPLLWNPWFFWFCFFYAWHLHLFSHNILYLFILLYPFCNQLTQLIQGIGCVPVPRGESISLTSPQSVMTPRFRYICLSGFVHQNHFFTLTHPGKMRRSPRRFCKDTVVSSYSNIAETEMKAHGWENISTPVYPTTSLSATLETKITVCQ